MAVRLLRRNGARRYDDGCSASLEAIGNRLAHAFCAAGNEDSLASEFIRFWSVFVHGIHAHILTCLVFFVPSFRFTPPLSQRIPNASKTSLLSDRYP